MLRMGSLAALLVLVQSGSAQDAHRDIAASYDLSANYSFSPGSDLESGGGEIEVQSFNFEAGAVIPLFEQWRIRAGIFTNKSDFDYTGLVTLPDELQAMGLSLSATKFFGDEGDNVWRTTFLLRPGSFSDSSGASGASFNAPGLLTFGKRISPTLSWDLGVRFDFRGEDEILPVLGLKWDFRPDWSLSLGLPKTEITYQMSENWTLNAGIRFQGGTYYIADVSDARLRDSYLDYREIRAGLGIEWNVTDSFSVNLDGGVVVDRQLDYFEKGSEVEGDSAGYFSFGLKSRF